jgi:hypothetical protein
LINWVDMEESIYLQWVEADEVSLYSTVTTTQDNALHAALLFL